jgi:SAM-dependent methyltransferase
MNGLDSPLPGVDADQPTAARMYDYYLGGATNFAADREAAKELIGHVPDVPLVARTNRAFLARAVRFLVGQGVDQFLDLGSGIPTVGNVHEIAQHAKPDARVVYVDTDRTAVVHAQHLLAGVPGTAAVCADLRDPQRVLHSLVVRDVLDLGRPIGLLVCAVLHFVPDGDDPPAILAGYRRYLAPGSCLVISHGTGDHRPTDQVQAGVDVYAHTVTQVTPRSHDQVVDLFSGWELMEPGVVWAPQWRPEPGQEAADSPEQSSTWAGVARRAPDSP